MKHVLVWAALLCGCGHGADSPGVDFARPGLDTAGYTADDLSVPELPDLACPVAPDPPWPDLGAPVSPLPSPIPQLHDRGGPRLQVMQAWTVVWSGDEAFGHATDQFLRWLYASDYWKLLEQYGVGPGVAAGVIVLPSPAPTDDSHIGDAVALALAQVPAPNDQTVLVFILPLGSSLSLPLAKAYHSELANGTLFALVPHQATLELYTELLSHEMAEAATDPLLYTKPALMGLGSCGDGVELADACSLHPVLVAAPDGGSSFSDGGADYTLARLWSNSAAAIGQPPCQPSPSPSPLPSANFGVAVDATPLVLRPFDPGDSCTPGVLLLRMQLYGPPDVPLIRWLLSVNTVPMQSFSGTNAPGDNVYLQIYLPEPGTLALQIQYQDARDATSATFGALVCVTGG